MYHAWEGRINAYKAPAGKSEGKRTLERPTIGERVILNGS
jgi:hypothetical protein